MDPLRKAAGIQADPGGIPVPLDDRGSSLTAKSIPELLSRHGLNPFDLENVEGPSAATAPIGLATREVRDRLASRLGDAFKNYGHVSQDIALQKLIERGRPNFERAIEQGYTTPVWHGTRANFDQFSPQLPGGDFGIHMASTPETANKAINLGREEVAELAAEGELPVTSYFRGANVMPLLAKIDKTVTLPDMGMWKSPGSWVNRLSGGALHSETGLPILRSTFGPSEISDKEFAREGLMRAWNMRGRLGERGEGYFDEFGNELSSLMDRAGYDTIAYTNLIEGKGEPSYLLKDPERIRSIWAKFQDPKSRNILAGLAGAGVAAPLMASHPVDNSR
jgi:hypothetical protein